MPYKHLTMDERNVIYRMKILDYNQSDIAKCLGRSAGTVSRELQRNANCDGRYWPGVANVKANARKRSHIQRPKTGDDKLMAHVADRLEQRWSPEQISGRLGEIGSAQLPGRTISHATIYRWIWADAERSNRFRPLLRVAWKPRRKPYGKPSKRGQIPNRVSIDDRPDIVDERSRTGDWEGDTVTGKARSGYVVTCVDRRSRFLLAGKVKRRTADAVNRTLTRALEQLPPEMRQTLTVDNGKEFARHEALADELGLSIYFAHAYSAWERGTNENTNGLLRQYLPKGRRFDDLTDHELQSHLDELNSRPRKCLNYRTPAEVQKDPCVALTM